MAVSCADGHMHVPLSRTWHFAAARPALLHPGPSPPQHLHASAPTPLPAAGTPTAA